MSRQIQIFLICAALGLMGGAIYDALGLLFSPFKKVRPVRIASDLIFCLLFTAGFLFVSLGLHFPDFRLYMAGGCLLGFFLYAKSLHKVVAFLGKKVYNGIRQIQKDRKQCQAKSGSSPKKKANGSPSRRSRRVSSS